MLSEYELLNVISEKRYTRPNKDKTSSDCKIGDIHVVDEAGTKERNYFRPKHIRNAFDLFMDEFSKHEDCFCVSDWTSNTIRWKTHIDVLEDVLTLASRITTLQLYSPLPQSSRIDGSPQITVGILLPPSSLALITELAMWSIGGIPILLSPQLSSHQIHLQLTHYSLKTLVTTSEIANLLLEYMRSDPTILPSLSSIILSDPEIDEESQKTAELFHIALYTATDLLNPSIHIQPISPLPIITKLELPLINTPPPNSHRRKLRLIRKEESKRNTKIKAKTKSKPRHKTSIDDYKKKPKETKAPLLFPFITYDPGLLDTAFIAVSLSRTQFIITIQRTHLQLLSQIDLWSQRILPTMLSKPSDFVFLADRTFCQIEEQGGRVCYVSSPCMKLPAMLTLQPSIMFVDSIDCTELVSQIEYAIATRKPALQQQLWKSYIQNKDRLLMINQLPSDRQNRYFNSLIQSLNLQSLRLLINTDSSVSCMTTLFLRTVLQCSIVQCLVSQELGSILFSTKWNDYNTFGHVGAPLMGMTAKLRSIPSAHLLITDRIHMRGVTTEEAIEEEIVNEVVLVQGSFYQKPASYQGQKKVFLCSSCHGRGEIWMSGVCFGGNDVNTHVYGLWRDDGSLEVLSV